jgi:hypothetical protein
MRGPVLMVLLTAGLCSTSGAQELTPTAPVPPRTVEITPTIGWRMGGGVESDDGAFDVESATSFGLILDVRALGWRSELLYDRQSSDVVRRSSTGPDSTVTDIVIEYFQLGGAVEFGHKPNLKPFFALTLGAAHLDPSGDRDDEWHFAGVATLGAKAYLGERVGLRAQTRLWGTFLTEESQIFCSLPGFCVLTASGKLFAERMAGGQWTWSNPR